MRKRNRSSGATIFLALVAAGVITVGKSTQQQINSMLPTVLIIIAALIIYIYKIRK